MVVPGRAQPGNKPAQADAPIFRFRTDSGWTHRLAFAHTGKLLLAAAPKRIEVWDLDKGIQLRKLEEVPETKLPPLVISTRGPWLTYFVSTLSASPDGKMAAATFARSGTECSLYLWDMATG